MTPDELSALKTVHFQGVDKLRRALSQSDYAGWDVFDAAIDRIQTIEAENARLHARDAIAAEVAAGAMDRAALIARIEALEAERAQVSAQMLQAKAELDDIAPRMATVLEHVNQLEAENARLRSIKVAAELARTQISSTETAYRVLNFALNTYKD